MEIKPYVYTSENAVCSIIQYQYIQKTDAVLASPGHCLNDTGNLEAQQTLLYYEINIHIIDMKTELMMSNECLFLSVLFFHSFISAIAKDQVFLN